MDVKQIAAHLRRGLLAGGTPSSPTIVNALPEHKSDEDRAREAVRLCEWQLSDLRERVGRAREQREASALHDRIGRVQDRLAAAQRALHGEGGGESVEDSARRLVLEFAARLRRRFQGEPDILDRIDAAAREVAGGAEGEDDGAESPWS